jgi:hypothetical protein
MWVSPSDEEKNPPEIRDVLEPVEKGGSIKCR